MSSPLPPKTSNRLPTVILLVLVFFGPPSLLTYTLTKTNAGIQNPWLIAFCVVLYELFALIMSFVLKIWQRLEGQWINEIASQFDVRVRSILSGYHRYYCQQLVYEHRGFDVKGLSTQGIYTLSMERVFVELQINPKPPHQISSNPVQAPYTLQPGGYTIWHYLKSKELVNQNVVIIGAPGCGKTTLLKHVALTLVDRKKRRRLSNRQRKLPILLFLRENVKAVKDNPKIPLADLVDAHLANWKRPVPSGWISTRLAKRTLLDPIRWS